MRKRKGKGRSRPMSYSLFEFASFAREFECQQARFARKPGGRGGWEQTEETIENNRWSLT